MDNNYRGNIAKWLPSPSSSHEKWFKDAVAVERRISKLIQEVASVLQLIIVQQESFVVEIEILEYLTEELKSLEKSYKVVSVIEKSSHPIYKFKIEHLSLLLRKKINALAKLISELVEEVLNCSKTDVLKTVLGLVKVYNEILSLDLNVSDPSISIFYNDCPLMLEPLKKISITRILQLMAKLKAEEHCHELINCLFANYKLSDTDVTLASPASLDIDIDDNSSIEIYRALTKHLTPPVQNVSTSDLDTGNLEIIEALIEVQNAQVVELLDIARSLSSDFFTEDVLRTNPNGEITLRRTATRKATTYYQEICWATVSRIVDHVVLWWSSDALAARHNHGARHLRDWLIKFIQNNRKIPDTIRPALQNLSDALGCYVTITSWDELFRVAYISAFQYQSQAQSIEGTNTGKMFADVFRLLVKLSNECESSGEWLMGAPLIELPMSEQIVVLHRLDHSVHTMRLWAIQEATVIAGTWELEIFFRIVKGDITNICLKELSTRKMADHTDALATNPEENVQVYVCAKMRAKIVAEVNSNIEQLMKAPVECISILAKICRVVSLANLHMCFPRANYWKRSNNSMPVGPSRYVKIYFDKVLLPVLEVVEDSEISNMILKIMCEAWLNYIYLHRVKFSESGALQLLADFAYVSNWVTECSIISQNVRGHLLKNEMLRQCEGVGRLLLRHRGETISMNKQPVRKTTNNGSPESLGLQRMPAEMYVPNQQQWLELRAASNTYNFCCTK